MSKYKAQPTVVDNIRFASKKEARRYGELKLLEKAREIRNLQCQVRFPLVTPDMGWSEWPRDPFHTSPLGVVKVADYVADFTYEERAPAPIGWHPVVEDVKGMKTPLYRLKKRWFEELYQLPIRET